MSLFMWAYTESQNIRYQEYVRYDVWGGVSYEPNCILLRLGLSCPVCFTALSMTALNSSTGTMMSWLIQKVYTSAPPFGDLESQNSGCEE